MSLIQTALCLPAPDIAGLIQGRTILAMPRIFINPGRQFALYPTNVEINALPLAEYYRPGFVSIAEKSLLEILDGKVKILVWAKCEDCQIINEVARFDILSKLTVWTEAGLNETLSKRGHIFLTYLRLYYLVEPVEMEVGLNSRFVSLRGNITATLAKAILTNHSFEQRYRQILNRQTPLHPEIEKLQENITPLIERNPKAKVLDQDLQKFLGWSKYYHPTQTNTDLEWIKKIAKVGNSSDGQEFEKLVRKSLIKLGFSNSNTDPKISLNPESTGGAGGLDFYCEAPYLLVGECKATKTEKVPDGTPAQLVKLGNKFLGDNYHKCIKLIMAAGILTKDANQTAVGNKMNVMRPETLEKLVELKAKYPGSINLFQLKEILAVEPFGEAADRKINQYIEEVEKQIKLRCHIVNVVKEHQEKARVENSTISELHTAYIYSQSPQKLSRQEMYDILLELASPLTGYLGRIKGEDKKSDAFTFYEI
ncbi:MAG: DUF1802 family protein [Microcoleaceae cyanobacterium MO_207.B10]|nr:DUF1802 family protein [Microcoleaceae cyanobacterium MO_207.B10]